MAFVLDKGSSPFGAALRDVHGTQARLVKLPFEMGIRRHIALIIKENSGNKRGATVCYNWARAERGKRCYD
jgi:hypothetical protein